ncbi:hypothetical protein [Spirosoma aerophilum]
MKTLFTLLLLTVGFSALAQRSSSKHVTTDGRQLRIRVDIEQPGRSVHYRRSFDVVDMDDKAVKALETHIIDSLDRAASEDASVVMVEQKRDTWNDRNEEKEQAVQVWRSEKIRYDRMEAHASSSLSPSDVAPLSVLVKEDKENGRLWMQYTFEKDGEELVIERTANVLGKTEREKQAIIKETERSFGIKTGNQ